MKVVIGLGNPGEKYLGTRHNLGFMALDSFAQKILDVKKFNWEMDKKIQGEIIKVSSDLWLVKPQTFMNNSGLCVKNLVDYYNISIDDLIIVYDELDLPIGQIKIRFGGAAAGHHGVESIIASLNTDKFLRVRLGIGNRHTTEAEHGQHHLDADKFVIDTFNSKERSEVRHMLKQTVKALDLILEKDFKVAQNQFN